jgi:zinc transport system ATP-binding protein
LAATEGLPIYQPLEIAVRFEGVTVERDGVSILDHVSAVAPKGSCTAIIGPNGAGKTTLLLALLGEIKYQGHIVISTWFPALGMSPSACILTGECR